MFFFSSRRRHTRLQGDWSSDVCSSDLCLLDAWPTWSDLQFAAMAWTVAASAISRRASGSAVAQPRRKIPGEIGRASCREREWTRTVAGCLADNQSRIYIDEGDHILNTQ